jgi:hypothetical protein
MGDKVYQCSCGMTWGGIGAKVLAMKHASGAKGNHMVKRVK